MFQSWCAGNRRQGTAITPTNPQSLPENSCNESKDLKSEEREN